MSAKVKPKKKEVNIRYSEKKSSKHWKLQRKKKKTKKEIIKKRIAEKRIRLSLRPNDTELMAACDENCISKMEKR